MQQAPGYQDQEQLRRDYVPPQRAYQGGPATPGAAAGPAGTAAHVGPVAWSDWVRWGPIWSGFFTILSTLAIVGSLGAAIGTSVWHANVPSAFSYGWFIMTGIIAYLLGGFVTARASGVSGMGAAILNGGLAWALALVALVVLVIFGASSFIGVLGTNITLLLHGVGPIIPSGNLATTAWVTFASLVIGLILAIVGAVIGTRHFSVGQHTV